MSDLKQYLPWLYKDVVEMDALMDTEDSLFSKLMDEYIRGRNNQYILTADEYGIRIFEDIINIDSLLANLFHLFSITTCKSNTFLYNKRQKSKENAKKMIKVLLL